MEWSKRLGIQIRPCDSAVEAVRHADIVFPVSTFLERSDIGGSAYDEYLTPMRAALPPYGDSRTDFAIFSELAERLGFGDDYSQNHSEMEWV